MTAIFPSSLLLTLVLTASLSSCQKHEIAAAAVEPDETLAARQAQDEQLRLERAAIDEERRQAITKLAEDSTLSALAAPPPEPAPPLAEIHQVPQNISYEPFYNDLSDHGSWMDSADYGYVWQPDVGHQDNWAPYTDGNWAYSDYGWAWESQESFGEICYHYGRWTQLQRIGWVWVPGNVWAPAWVSWRSGDDCIGWAPLPPAARWHGRVGIHEWIDGTCHIPPAHYCFVPIQQLCHEHCRDLLLPRNECEQRFLHTHNVTSLTEVHSGHSAPIVRCDGPGLEQVRAAAGGELRERKIQFQEPAVGKSQLRTQLSEGSLPMRQWTLHTTTPHEAKPKVVSRQLPPVLDEIKDRAGRESAAVKRMLALEATAALKKNPIPSMDRGPRRPDPKPEPEPPTNRLQPMQQADRDVGQNPPPARREIAQSPPTNQGNTKPDATKQSDRPQPQVVDPATRAAEQAQKQQALVAQFEERKALEAQWAKSQRQKNSLPQVPNPPAKETRTSEPPQETAADQRALLQREQARHDAEVAHQKELAQRDHARDVALQGNDLAQRQLDAQRTETERQQAMTQARQKQDEAKHQEEQHAKQEAARLAAQEQLKARAEAKQAQQQAASQQAMQEKQQAARDTEAERQKALAETRQQQVEAQRQQSMQEKQQAAHNAEAERQKALAETRQQQVEAQRQQAMADARQKQEDAQRQQAEARRVEADRQQAMNEARRQQEEQQRQQSMQRQQEDARRAEAQHQQAMADARQKQEDAQRRAEAERQQREAAERANQEAARRAAKQPGSK